MIVPIRNLGKLGVNTDIDPFSLPTEAFTMGVNVRFEDLKISRGPLFRQAGALYVAGKPRYTMSFVDSLGAPHLLIGHDTGTVTNWVSTGAGTASNADFSVSGYVQNAYQTPFTSCIVNDVVYLNREDRIPWYMTTTGTQMLKMPTGSGLWDPSWRCKSLRTCAGVLVAINVTKGAVNYDTMVKTSDYMTFDSPPNAWVGTESNSATENLLPMIQEPLLDGWPLRDALCLYTRHNTVLMQPTYDNQMFSYRLLFNKRGVINQNCVVDVDNRHYVFGPDDIWQHDGFNPASLASGRVRKFIYSNMVSSQSWQNFAVHNPMLDEVMFCFVSRDQFCAYPPSVGGAYPGCNRAAVYNYRCDTWYFYDLPYVTHGNLGSPVIGSTFDSIGSVSFATIAGSYSTLLDTDKLAMCMVGPSVSSPLGDLTCSVRTFEPFDSVTASGVTDAAACAPVYLENAEIDLDNLQTQLRGYKVVKSIYPEGRFSYGSPPLSFAFGASDFCSSPAPVYDDPVTFDGGSQYKLDYMTAGRFLSIKVTYASPDSSFSLSGLDLDFQVTGSR